MDLLLRDRTTAGRQLATALGNYGKRRNVVVFAVSPGGVPVAAEVAEALEAPLDLIISRVLPVPGEAGLSLGSVATGGARALDWGVVSALDLSDATIQRVCESGEAEVERLMNLYRGHRLQPDIYRQRVILVDDGLDNATALHAAVAAVRALKPAEVVLAVPVARFDVLKQLRGEVDEVVCLATPYPFESVSRWYWFLPDVTVEDVRDTLARRWFAEDERAMQIGKRRVRREDRLHRTTRDGAQCTKQTRATQRVTVPQAAEPH